MGNTNVRARRVVPDTSQPREVRVAESLATIGLRLDAQRVELFSITRSGNASLDAWWSSVEVEQTQPESEVQAGTVLIPLDWFPWSIGNIRASEYVFVRNAGPLARRPGVAQTLADVGMCSALHLPLAGDADMVGAICVYWSEGRSDWSSTEGDDVRSLGVAALSELAASIPGDSDRVVSGLR